MLGVLTFVIAAYHLLAARTGLTVFFRWTVFVRGGGFVVFGALVLLHLAPPPLAMFGAVDLAVHVAGLFSAAATRPVSTVARPPKQICFIASISPIGWTA